MFLLLSESGVTSSVGSHFSIGTTMIPGRVGCPCGLGMPSCIWSLSARL